MAGPDVGPISDSLSVVQAMPNGKAILVSFEVSISESLNVIIVVMSYAYTSQN